MPASARPLCPLRGSGALKFPQFQIAAGAFTSTRELGCPPARSTGFSPNTVHLRGMQLRSNQSLALSSRGEAEGSAFSCALNSFAKARKKQIPRFAPSKKRRSRRAVENARKKQFLRYAEDDAAFVFHPLRWAAGPCHTRDDKLLLIRHSKTNP